MSVKSRGNQRPLIVRREEVAEEHRHGGAWKVAYADFVTAMMAFFLLMWLINATTEAQRQGLADYFSKANVLSRQNSGSGRPFGGKTPFDPSVMVSNSGALQVVRGKAQVLDQPDDDSDTAAQARQYHEAGDRVAPGRQESTSTGDFAGGAGESGIAKTGPAHDGVVKTGQKAASGNPALTAAQQAAREQAAFGQAAQALQEAVKSDPALSPFAKQLAVDNTPEGLRIQLLDDEDKPMFAFGSDVPNERARLLLQKIAPVLEKLPEMISISGHTDAAPFRGSGKTNWELSAERANATRRVLATGGVPDSRFRAVTGDADRDPLLPADPFAAANRRIAIVVLRAAPVVPLPAAAPTGR